jgi:hypothetical protein
MINIISSTASAPNTLLHEVPRREHEDNLRWLSRQPRPGADQTGIVLRHSKPFRDSVLSSMVWN